MLNGLTQKWCFLFTTTTSVVFFQLFYNNYYFNTQHKYIFFCLNNDWIDAITQTIDHSLCFEFSEWHIILYFFYVIWYSLIIVNTFLKWIFKLRSLILSAKERILNSFCCTITIRVLVNVTIRYHCYCQNEIHYMIPKYSAYFYHLI